MGNFRFTMNAVGGHGCQRDKKDGETVEGCGESWCPDCKIREFLKTLGCSIQTATLEHWPDTSEQVTDDLVTKTRKGSF
jgi:hypothetical protein